MSRFIKCDAPGCTKERPAEADPMHWITLQWRFPNQAGTVYRVAFCSLECLEKKVAMWMTEAPEAA